MPHRIPHPASRISTVAAEPFGMRDAVTNNNCCV